MPRLRIADAAPIAILLSSHITASGRKLPLSSSSIISKPLCLLYVPYFMEDSGTFSPKIRIEETNPCNRCLEISSDWGPPINAIWVYPHLVRYSVARCPETWLLISIQQAVLEKGGLPMITWGNPVFTRSSTSEREVEEPWTNIPSAARRPMILEAFWQAVSLSCTPRKLKLKFFSWTIFCAPHIISNMWGLWNAVRGSVTAKKIMLSERSLAKLLACALGW